MITDRQLRTNVQDELEWDPSVDARSIGVAVENGIVTLNGIVRSFSEKWAAENAAERVAGVKAVSDELEVQVPGDCARTDTDIARAALEALSWNVNVRDDRVKVQVDHGFVTLQGELNYQFQKEAAGAAVRHLIGVTGVANELTVKPSVPDAAIKERIEKAILRAAQLDASRVAVEVKGSEVTLRGQVRTWLERTQAQDAAWRAPGVHHVKNDIKIVN